MYLYARLSNFISNDKHDMAPLGDALRQPSMRGSKTIYDRTTTYERFLRSLRIIYTKKNDKKPL